VIYCQNISQITTNLVRRFSVDVIAVTGAGDHSVVEGSSSDVCRQVSETRGLSWRWTAWIGTWSRAKRTPLCWGVDLLLIVIGYVCKLCPY